MPSRFNPGCNCCGDDPDTVDSVCCDPVVQVPTTLYLHYEYGQVARCGGAGVVAVSVPLVYHASYTFPLTGNTGPAWVGCHVELDQESAVGQAPGSPFLACIDTPAYFVFSGNADELAHYDVSGCAALVRYQPWDNVNGSPGTSDNWRIPGDCSIAAGDPSYGWATSAFGVGTADVECSPAFLATLPDGSTIDESP